MMLYRNSRHVPLSVVTLTAADSCCQGVMVKARDASNANYKKNVK